MWDLTSCPLILPTLMEYSGTSTHYKDRQRREKETLHVVVMYRRFKRIIVSNTDEVNTVW